MPEIEVTGRKVRFGDVGSGEPVLLLHTLLHTTGSSSGQWHSLSDMLLAHGGLRVLAPDLQDHGGSGPWDPRQPLRLEDWSCPQLWSGGYASSRAV